MVIGDPLSLVGFTQSTTILERSEAGFRARSETSTNIWSETDGAGGYVFRYRATVKTFTGGPEGIDQPCAEKTVPARSRALGFDRLRRHALASGLRLFTGLRLGRLVCLQSGPLPSDTPAVTADVPEPQKGWFRPPCCSF